jgi:hypothetical protein
MSDMIFVHGTGVRQPSYDETFNILKHQLSIFLPGYNLHRCYWGETQGCRLRGDGASIPDYDTSRAPGDVSAQDINMAAWQALYADPDSELDSFLAQPGTAREFDPFADPPLETVTRLLARETDRTRALELELGLAGVWDRAKEELLAFLRAAVNANRTLPEADESFRSALARALFAHAMVLLEESGRQNWPTGQERDTLLEALAEAWGGHDMGMISAAAGWVGDRIKRVVLNIGTDKVARKRGVISDAAYPAAGDILLYQARGAGIRDFIEQAICDVADPVVVLAHSLGGIACVDLMIEKKLKNVIKLITVGSQAPLLYEMNALCKLPYGDPLPPGFPEWINFYDNYDFLSYKGAELFPKRVKDILVDNEQPFPESHSAYWRNPEVWKAISGRKS